jgi:chloramphenicol O-acetyltransferase type A
MECPFYSIIEGCVVVTLQQKMEKVNPEETTRAYAFEMWRNAPMPMVTVFKTLDVSPLRRVARKYGLKFNMLMCWCIGKAASAIKEFYMLPVGDSLVRYDSLAVNAIAADFRGEVSSCDVPFSDNIFVFNDDYMRLTRQVAASGENHDIIDSMVIGTSALVGYDIDGAVGMYSGIFNNPFCIWGRWRRKWFRTHLTLSFQFHHTQMDGAHAGRFLSLLQETIAGFSRSVPHV